MSETTVTRSLEAGGGRPGSTGVTPGVPWRVKLADLTDAERARVLPAVRRRRWT
jgi:vancomycin resistance protein VanW